MLTIANKTTAPKNDATNERISKLPLVIGAPPIRGVMTKPAQNAADDQNDDNIHVISPFQSAKENIARAIWFRFCLILVQPGNLAAVPRNHAAAFVVTHAELNFEK
jgi:hypothetical protein